MLAGRNGSGKSTLLRVLATAIRADRGTARVAGHDVRGERGEVRRRVALLGHHSQHYEALTAAREPGGRGALPGRRLDAAAPLLGRVGLADRADDPVSTFSAGHAQAAGAGPGPAAGRDGGAAGRALRRAGPARASHLLDRVLGELRAAARTVLVATHLLERGRALCDQALVLEGGRLAWSGPAAEAPDGCGTAGPGT